MQEHYTLTDKVLQFFAILHSGGDWGYYWTAPEKITQWWKAGQPGELPNSQSNVYFGVHPAKSKGTAKTRAKIADIAAINCLFAEFDAKDFEGGKTESLTHAALLQPSPSVIIDSGNGYHAYWLLKKTFKLESDQDRNQARELQAAWVAFVGGDPGAKDLARVLRIPGTNNHKTDPPKPVIVKWADLDLRHDIDYLAELSKPQEAKPAKVAAIPQDTANDWGAYFLKQARLRATVGTRNDTGTWLALQLRDNRLPMSEQEQIMRSYQATAPGDGYTEAEALATLKSVHSRPPRDPVTSKKASNKPDYKPQSSLPDELPKPDKEEIEQMEAASWADIAALLGPITWSWEPWLPDGMLTILASEPGTGKSALCLRIAETFLTGKAWPDGIPFDGEAGQVLWVEAEAAQAINLDRAQKWGLPTDKILTPTDNPLEDVKLDNDKHKYRVEYLAKRDDVRLIVIDSLRGVLAGDENSSDTIDLVMWLAQLARDTSKPILLTHHLRKRGLFDGDEKPNLDRLRGSTAIVQGARVVWALDTPDPYNEAMRRVSVIKNNLAAFAEPLGMYINDTGVHFGDAPEKPRTETQSDKAADIIMALLQKEPMLSVDILEELRQAGISEATAKRAKQKLGINAIRKEDGRWYWSLPERGVGDYLL